MAVAQARKLCPDGVYLPVRHALYKEYSQRVMQVLGGISAQLEQVSIDEAYLDLSAASDPVELAELCQQRIKTEIGLGASVGLATNKLTAKMASGYHKPQGFTVVLPGHEAEFLAPQPLEKLFGIGPKSAERLRERGLETIGDVARTDLQTLRETFGPQLGLDVHQHASGYDPRPIVTARETKSLSLEQTLFDDVADRAELWRYIQSMASGLEERLKTQHLLARTVAIKLRFPNWKTVTRAETLFTPTDSAGMIAHTAGRLMRQAWKRGTPLRLIGLRVSNFVEDNAPRQLILPLNF
jgi:DNA polymerase-4